MRDFFNDAIKPLFVLVFTPLVRFYQLLNSMARNLTRDNWGIAWHLGGCYFLTMNAAGLLFKYTLWAPVWLFVLPGAAVFITGYLLETGNGRASDSGQDIAANSLGIGLAWLTLLLFI